MLSNVNDVAFFLLSHTLLGAGDGGVVRLWLIHEYIWQLVAGSPLCWQVSGVATHAGRMGGGGVFEQRAQRYPGKSRVLLCATSPHLLWLQCCCWCKPPVTARSCGHQAHNRRGWAAAPAHSFPCFIHAGGFLLSYAGLPLAVIVAGTLKLWFSQQRQIAQAVTITGCSLDETNMKCSYWQYNVHCMSLSLLQLHQRGAVNTHRCYLSVRLCLPGK